MSVYQRLDIYKRINQLDQMSQNIQGFDVINIFHYEDKNNYLIFYKGDVYECDNLDEFYKDKGLDKSSKKLITYNFSVVKNRTEDDIYD